MIPGVNIVSRKASMPSVRGAAGGSLGALWATQLVFWGARSPLRIFLGSKKRLDWLKIDLSVAKIITVQGYKCTKNTVLKQRVKEVTEIMSIQKRPKLNENQLRILKIYAFCQKIQQRALFSGEITAGVRYVWE